MNKPRDEPAANTPDDKPWWRYRMVWLVVGGPAIVVLASLGTAVVAYRGADVVLTEISSARDVPVRPTSTTPAEKARNHAATAADQ